MSNRSTYSTASGVSSLYSASGYYPRNNRLQSNHLPVDPSTIKVAKEAEVDHLTDLLVQSMENSNDPDFFGKSQGRASNSIALLARSASHRNALLVFLHSPHSLTLPLSQI